MIGRALVLGLFACTRIMVAEYVFQTIDAPGPAVAINDSGQILIGGVGVLNSDGTFTTIEVPGSFETVLTGINDSGTVIGYSRTDASLNPPYSFLYNAGTFTPITVPGSIYTETAGISDEGQFVGTYIPMCNCVALGFLYNGAKFTTLNVPFSLAMYPNAVNNSGEIVGRAELVGGPGNVFSEGFLYSKGNYTTFPPFDNRGDTVFTGINDAGDIVGHKGANGFVYKNGVFSSLAVPGSSFTAPVGINDAGEIVGLYGTGLFRKSFLAIPVPEPGTLVLIVSGFLISGLTWVLRNRF